MNYALVPVRGGSKTIPLKNIKIINGKPLVWWVLDAANRSNLDMTFVATDSELIKKTVDGFGFKRVVTIDRSPATAGDTSPTEHVMEEFAKKYEFDGFMLIQATSPLTTDRHINEILEMYERKEFDSMTPLVPQKKFVWKKMFDKWTPINFDPKNRPMRQKMEVAYVGCGAVYMMNRDKFLLDKCRLHGNIGAYVFPESMGIELDEPWQWPVVEALLKEKYG
jgi:N-acylneuraminate cytidylyltransferase